MEEVVRQEAAAGAAGETLGVAGAVASYRGNLYHLATICSRATLGGTFAAGESGTRSLARSEPEADKAEKEARSRESLADPLLSNADNAVSSSSNQNENLSFPWPCLVWEEQDNTNWFTIQLAVIVEDGCLKLHKMAVWHDVEKDEVREAITRGSEFIKEQFSSEESASEELKDG